MNASPTYRTRLNFFQRLIDASYSQLFLIWVVLNAIFAALYFALSIANPAHGPNFLTDLSIAKRLFNSAYFSIVTATTVGFGDIVPLGFSKLLVMLQSTSAFLVFAVLVGKLVSQRQDHALNEVHRMTFEGIFSQIRNGLFTVRKDFDELIQKADQGKKLTENDWSMLSTAYLQAENLVEQIPDLYMGLDYSLNSIDLKRERLLFESIHRTLQRLTLLIDRLDGAKIDWVNHVESSRELSTFIEIIDTIMPLWRSRSPHHEVKEFEDIRSLSEALHKEMKWKISK